MNSLRKTLIKNIVRLREANGWSAYRFAQLLNTTPATVSRWESLENEPDLERIAQIAALFHVTPQELFAGSVQPKRVSVPEPSVEDAFRVLRKAVSNKKGKVKVRLPEILWVDDETFVRSEMAKKLRAKGYTVHECNNGKEGLKFLKTHKIDIVISDNRMPELSGLAMLQEINAKYPHIIKILATSSAVPVSTIYEIHIDSYISKPFKDYAVVYKEVERLWRLRVDTVKHF